MSEMVEQETPETEPEEPSVRKTSRRKRKSAVQNAEDVQPKKTRRKKTDDTAASADAGKPKRTRKKKTDNAEASAPFPSAEEKPKRTRRKKTAVKPEETVPEKAAPEEPAAVEEPAAAEVLAPEETAVIAEADMDAAEPAADIAEEVPAVNNDAVQEQEETEPAAETAAEESNPVIPEEPVPDEEAAEETIPVTPEEPEQAVEPDSTEETPEEQKEEPAEENPAPAGGENAVQASPLSEKAAQIMTGLQKMLQSIGAMFTARKQETDTGKENPVEAEPAPAETPAEEPAPEVPANAPAEEDTVPVQETGEETSVDIPEETEAEEAQPEPAADPVPEEEPVPEENRLPDDILAILNSPHVDDEEETKPLEIIREDPEILAREQQITDRGDVPVVMEESVPGRMPSFLKLLKNPFLYIETLNRSGEYDKLLLVFAVLLKWALPLVIAAMGLSAAINQLPFSYVRMTFSDTAWLWFRAVCTGYLADWAAVWAMTLYLTHRLSRNDFWYQTGGDRMFLGIKLGIYTAAAVLGLFSLSAGIALFAAGMTASMLIRCEITLKQAENRISAYIAVCIYTFVLVLICCVLIRIGFMDILRILSAI